MDDLMGDGVNVAARLEGVAKPDAICLSEDAYRQVKGRLDLAVTELGPTIPRNADVQELAAARGWSGYHFRQSFICNVCATGRSRGSFSFGTRYSDASFRNSPHWSAYLARRVPTAEQLFPMNVRWSRRSRSKRNCTSNGRKCAASDAFITI